MTKRLVCSAAVAAGGIGAAPGLAAEPTVFEVPALDGIHIDGVADDWQARGFRVDMLGNEVGRISTPENFDVRFRLGWDADGLLLLVKVRDNLYDVGDKIEMTLARDADADEVYHVAISPGLHSVDTNMTVSLKDLRDDSRRDEKLFMGPAEIKEAEGRYVIEALLPWGNLGIEAESGSEFGFQLVARDVDPSKDGYGHYHGAFWNSAGMNRLRLGSTPSAPTLNVACGHEASWQPRVQIVGPADFAGKKVKVLREREVLAKGRLELGDTSFGETDRASAVLKLAYPAPADASKDLTVSIDGDAVATVLLPRPELPEIKIRVEREESTAKSALVQTDLMPLGDHYPFLKVLIEVSDQNGRRIKRKKGALGGQVKVKLPDGFSLVRARVDDFEGRMMDDEVGCFVGEDIDSAIQNVVTKARDVQRGKKHQGSAGWFDFLIRQIEEHPPKEHPMTRSNVDLAARLAYWTARIEDKRNPLATARGRLEWAYLSKVDGTGQPFVLGIPRNYDPDRLYMLQVGIPGSGGLHNMPWNDGYEDGFLSLRIFARARHTGFGSLSEVAVLEAIEYVKKHWNVDPDRVHLGGGSMGGGGTFQITARHPHIFASASPVCSFGMHVPVENLLHVPFYTLHSDDDFAVVVGASRAPMARLAALGGMAIQDETTGIGHSILFYTKGNDRAKVWTRGQIRPASVSRFRYTALDELANGAYWCRVREWGDEGRPAQMNVSAANDNALFLSFDNVRVAEVSVEKSPLDRGRSTRVVVNSTIAAEIESPLPSTLWITRQEDAWRVETEKPQAPEKRLHFPGGGVALYHGEPLMVVWGTTGSEDINKEIYEVAQIARKSSRVAWPQYESQEVIYGQLVGKPDVEVTAADMAMHNLLLIGTAAQNALVARLAEQLPVQIDDERVVTTDGVSWSFKDRALGLLYYNPVAPHRLIYWVASDAIGFYERGTPLIQSQGWGFAPADLLVMHAEREQTVAARRFDSRWSWEPGYGDSDVVDAYVASPGGYAAVMADAYRRATGADFALMKADWNSKDNILAPSETRNIDIPAQFYDERIPLMDLTGEELLDAMVAFKKQKTNGKTCRFLPAPEDANVKPKRKYRIAMQPWTIFDFATATKFNPPSFRMTEQSIKEALERHWLEAVRSSRKRAVTSSL